MRARGATRVHVRVRCSSLFRSCPAHRLIPPLARHTFHRLCLAALGAVAAAAGSQGGSRGGAPSGCTHRPLCRHPHRAAAAPRRAAAACHRPAAEALSRDRLHLLWLPCCLRGRTPVLALSYPVCVRVCGWPRASSSENKKAQSRFEVSETLTGGTVRRTGLTRARACSNCRAPCMAPRRVRRLSEE